MGIPGQWDDPKLIDNCVKSLETAKAHGKIAATVCPTPEMTARWKELGVHLLCIASDVGLLKVALTEKLEAVKAL